MSAGRFCTQCEAEGFRKITYFPDRPDVLARFTVRSSSEQVFPRLLSNGNLVEAGDLPGGRHFAVWNDPFPKPCYLFALVAGELDVLEDRFVTMSGREVTLRRCRHRHGRSRPLRDGQPQALDEVGRGHLGPRVRPRPVHDRRRARLQFRGDYVLLAADPDLFNRWEAGQELARDLILARAAGAPDEVGEERYAEAMGRAMEDQSAEDAFKALMLSLPSESDLALARNPADPAAIHEAREAIRARLAVHPGRDAAPAARSAAEQRGLRARRRQRRTARPAQRRADRAAGGRSALAQP